MRAGTGYGDLTVSAAMVDFKLALDLKCGQDFGSPIRWPIGPEGEYKREFGSEFRRLVPGKLLQPVTRALGQERNFVRIAIGGKSHLEGTGIEVEGCAGSELAFIKLRLRNNQGQVGRAPGSIEGQFIEAEFG